MAYREPDAEARPLEGHTHRMRPFGRPIHSLPESFVAIRTLGEDVKAIEVIPQADLVAGAVSATETIRVNAGLSSPFTDASGQVWAPDSGFEGGMMNPGTLALGGGAATRVGLIEPDLPGEIGQCRVEVRSDGGDRAGVEHLHALIEQECLGGIGLTWVRTRVALGERIGDPNAAVAEPILGPADHGQVVGRLLF